MLVDASLLRIAFAVTLFTSPLNCQTAEQPSLAPMLEKVLPTVVSISVEGQVSEDTGFAAPTPPTKRLFRLTDDESGTPQSLITKGSGVVIDSARGLILTNNHLLENADTITVGVSDGSTFPADIVGADPQTDIAVLHIKAPNLAAIKVGDSGKLRVGDYVVAVGNPFGLKQTATLGIVSGLDRSAVGFADNEDFIQTDAALNPGNSGGALVNLDGELIGINTAIIGSGGTNAGIGFAIPINLAMRIARELIAHGRIDRGQIGVIVQDVTPELAKVLTVAVTSGALVSEVLEGSPAETAGLQPGDAITSLDRVAIHSATELRNAVSEHAPGTVIAAKGFRGRLRIEVSIKVGTERPASTDTVPAVSLTEGILRDVTLQDVVLRPRGKALGIQVLMLSPDSPAARAGLAAGDLIVALNQKPVGSLNDVGDWELSHDLLLLTVYRDGHSIFILVSA
jgi:Do/DeqQ family serine protease